MTSQLYEAKQKSFEFSENTLNRVVHDQSYLRRIYKYMSPVEKGRLAEALNIRREINAR